MKLIALGMTPLEPKWLRSDLTQRLRSHLTQHAGMGSEAKVIELAGGKSGHLKLLGPLYSQEFGDRLAAVPVGTPKLPPGAVAGIIAWAALF